MLGGTEDKLLLWRNLQQRNQSGECEGKRSEQKRVREQHTGS